MYKMGSHDPFAHLKQKLCLREGSRVGNCPDFLACRWLATYRWKAFDKGYNFILSLISIRSLHAKLWAPNVARIPVVGISRLLRIPRQNDIWALVPWPIMKYTTKGKLVASPKSGLWRVL